MASKEKILSVLKGKRAYLQNHFSVSNIALFGSHVRDDAHEASDIDILVSLLEPTFDHYMELKFYLEELLGCQVDLVLENTVKKRLQAVIQQEAVYV
ncbi:MAG: hypothetical protein CDV28_10843 [Candidatus Electronema aureum]|uniref:Polymerase nucleotidyl transferase domain-containing protein n=1 Tax=Candidatus Electronema aureum TaxID=2005002 RepID=A0A521G2Q1_9BACT|nr:MAG: hypothetical protein CDV28_10843 [Candidatus Electronema aureum]